LYKSYVCDRKFLRASVGARHSPSKLGSALASRNLVNLLYRRFSVSERLSKLSRISWRLLARPSRNWNGSFLIPNILIKKYVASCTTSVYVNLSKNSFFTLNAQKLGESGCKGTNNFNTNQTFSIKNSQKYKDFRECWQIRTTPYILYIGLFASSKDPEEVNEQIHEV